MKLSGPQIAGYAAGAGFPSGQIATAVAIALAESGGQTDQLSDQTLQTAKWGPSVGVWQIRSLKPAYLAKATGADTYRDASKLTDPSFNAAAAHAIYAEAGGWGPWSTYPGTYLLYLPQGRAAAQAPAAVAAGGSGSTGTTSLGVIQPAGYGLDDLGSDALKGLQLTSPAVGIPLNLGLDLLKSPADMLGAAKQGVGLLANLLGFIVKAAVWIGNPHNWLRIAKVWLGTWLVVLGLAMAAWPSLSPVVNTVAGVVPAGKAAKAAGAARSAKAATAAAAVA